MRIRKYFITCYIYYSAGDVFTFLLDKKVLSVINAT